MTFYYNPDATPEELLKSIEEIFKEANGALSEPMVKYLSRHAEALSNGNGLDPNDDADLRNAIAHAQKSLEISTKYSEAVAEWLGDIKEGDTPEIFERYDEWRDQYNNEIGRDIAQWMTDNNYTENDTNPDTGNNYTWEELDKIKDDLLIDAANNGDLKTNASPEKSAPKDPATGAPLDSNGDPINPKDAQWDGPTGGNAIDPQTGKTAWDDTSQGRDYTNTAPDPISDPVGSAIYRATDVLNALVYAGYVLYDEGTDVVGSAYVAAQQALNDLGAALQGFLDTAGQGLEDLGDWMWDVWEATGDARWTGSPLVLDLDGDGVELVSLANATLYWDIDEDGFSEVTGWAGADDGLLAIDLDGDGAITTHAELFGSITQDGFTALSVYDTNTDGIMDANDAQFGDLLVIANDNIHNCKLKLVA